MTICLTFRRVDVSYLDISDREQSVTVVEMFSGCFVWVAMSQGQFVGGRNVKAPYNPTTVSAVKTEASEQKNKKRPFFVKKRSLFAI